MEHNNIIPSVNYHLWQPCNMNCKFCFATFNDVKREVLPKGHLSREESLNLIDKIINAGFRKVTFAGGEPTLCPWLPELIKKVKKGGLTTMLVTNGSFLSESFLNSMRSGLDWIVLSVDSTEGNTNFRLGRFDRKFIPNEQYYNNLFLKIRQRGYRLKINTVVTKQNFQEQMDKFIISSGAERWKVFQVLPIRGQNDKYVEQLSISQEEFDLFVKKHEHVKEIGIDIIIENNEAMTGSYLMIDPAGRFYDNVDKSYHYSSSILKIGIENALSEIRIDHQKFIERQGLYNWELTS